MAPLDCDPNSAEPDLDLPGTTTLFSDLQLLFLNRKLPIPVSDYERLRNDWSWRQRTATEQHRLFTEERPQRFVSGREKIVIEFYKYLKKADVPLYLSEPIAKLFYNEPKVIFATPMRTDRTPTSGIPDRNTLSTIDNPNWRPPTDPATVPVPWGVARDSAFVDHPPDRFPDLPERPFLYWPAWRFIDIIMDIISQHPFVDQELDGPHVIDI
jgi:hypothetical protein